jgi:hypothetical protein
MYSDISGEFAVLTILACGLLVGLVTAGFNVAQQQQDYELSGAKGDFWKDYFNPYETGIEFVYGFAMTAITMSTGLTGYTYFGARMGLSLFRSVGVGIVNGDSFGEIALSTTINLGITALFTYNSINNSNLDIPIRGAFLDNFTDNALVITDYLILQSILTGTGRAVVNTLKYDYNAVRD